ncbi:LysB family phage lysis regulatory protein [Burkholderia sp. Ac-20379]|nr:LysB family phage lysis regulatory protein [Burkholderia sp. Ac-20379]
MTLASLRLWISLAVLAAAGAGCVYVRALQTLLADATREAGQAHQDLAARDAVVARLQAAAREQDAARARLERTRGAVNAQLASYQQQLRKLIDENQAVRTWAGTALPDDVVRLHDSAALTGADAYAERLRGGDALHDAGDVAAHQR